MEITILFEQTVVPSYTLFCIFVIFAYQEINNKIREGFRSFREWVKLRMNDQSRELYQEKVLLRSLGVDKEPDSWLEKDMIFHVYYFLRSVDKNEKGASYRKAAKDYYNYLKENFYFKTIIKRILFFQSIFCFLIICSYEFIKKEYGQINILFYVWFVLIVFSIFEILKGPKLEFINNTITNKKNDPCLSGSEKEIEELKRALRSI